jgi:hypothetical protein
MGAVYFSSTVANREHAPELERIIARRAGSLIMPADIVSDGESHDDLHHVIYLTKHAHYELTVVAPQCPATRLSWEYAVVHARFRTARQVHDITLPLADIELFYEDVGRLMEYLQNSPALVPRSDPP